MDDLTFSSLTSAIIIYYSQLADVAYSPFGCTYTKFLDMTGNCTAKRFVYLKKYISNMRSLMIFAVVIHKYSQFLTEFEKQKKEVLNLAGMFFYGYFIIRIWDSQIIIGLG